MAEVLNEVDEEEDQNEEKEKVTQTDVHLLKKVKLGTKLLVLEINHTESKEDMVLHGDQGQQVEREVNQELK